ncbi:MAG: hypothetical protein M3198_03225 [Actinomycetota bacterium]|nr:hypothetical protein [Actinomycetota bacterium]
MIREAVEALDDAGVRYSFRKGPRTDAQLPAGGEIDLAVERSEMKKVHCALTGAGFFHLQAPGHLDHHFYVTARDGLWLKVDLKTPAGAASAGFLGRLRRSLGMRRPVGLRRAGPVVAIVGPDGAGKGSLIDLLRARLPLGVAVVYFGAPKKAGSPRAEATPPPEESPNPLRECAWIVLRWGKAWRRLLGAYARAWRGSVVLCDRYPVEVLATRPRRTRLGAPIERALFGRLVPLPDALVVLDAPGEALFVRKGEHSPEILERWRRGYVESLGPKGARIVSTDRPLEESFAEVSDIVFEQLRARRRW